MYCGLRWFCIRLLVLFLGVFLLMQYELKSAGIVCMGVNISVVLHKASLCDYFPVILDSWGKLA